MMSRIVWLAIIAAAPAQVARGDGALRERFFREAPAGWGRLREAARQVAGTLRYEAWSIQDGKRNAAWGYDKYARFRRNGDWVVLTITASGENQSIIVGAGPRYAFSLKREGEGMPALTGLSFGAAEVTSREIRSSTQFFHALESSHVWWTIPLEKLFQDRGIVVTDVAQSRDQGREVVTVVFEGTTSEPKHPWKGVRMAFLPALDWALLRVESDPRGDWHEVIVNEYRPNRNGRVALYKHEKVGYFSADKIEEDYRYTFEELEDRAEPESAFTLTAFRLPEPGEPARSSPAEGRLHYWLIGGAVGLFVAAIGLRRAAR